MNETLLKIQKIGGGLAILSSISFVYYFIGFIYTQSYFETLGVSRTFLDFNYQDYVIEGILNSLILSFPESSIFSLKGY